MKAKPMTKTTLLVLALLTLPCAFAQSPPPSPGPAATPGQSFSERLQSTIKAAATPEVVLTKFSLDFPGGSPKQLVATIERAMGKPLNAIIPPEHTDVKLPPLKMNNVDVDQLFKAIELTSLKREPYVTGTSNPGSRQVPSYSIMQTTSSFKTYGPPSDDCIWYFYVEKPVTPPIQASTPPKICRYFSLAPYLDRGQTVDDITTAIQTGWKMLGEDNVPKISVHKEAKFLIGVGEPGQLETIDAVLQALKTPSFPRYIDPATGIPIVPPPTVADPSSSVPPTRLPQRALKTPPPETKPPGDSKP